VGIIADFFSRFVDSSVFIGISSIASILGLFVSCFVLWKSISIRRAILRQKYNDGREALASKFKGHRDSITQDDKWKDVRLRQTLIFNITDDVNVIQSKFKRVLKFGYGRKLRKLKSDLRTPNVGANHIAIQITDVIGMLKEEM